jgi:hypothetical protein
MNDWTLRLFLKAFAIQELDQGNGNANDMNSPEHGPQQQR